MITRMDEPLKERLKRALQTHNLLQKDFAEMSGLRPSVVSNILLGRDSRMSTFAKADRVLRQLEAADAPAPR